jgi:GTP-binding protein
VTTGQLNAVIKKIVERNHPPMRKNRNPKIFFATQIDVAPPTIVVKCNEPKLIDKGWQRFLLTALHDALPFPEVPIKVYYRSRGRAEGDSPEEPETEEVVVNSEDDLLDVELADE